jgi:Aspartate/tyrosine/aromatic aminotransferase
MKHAFSQQMRNALKSTESLFRFYMTDSAYSRRKNDPGISNFVLGNPQEMPLPGFTEALQRWSVPQNKDWFAYRRNMPEAQAVVADSLQERIGMPFEAADVAMTNGAFGGLAAVIGSIAGPGDEVVFISPPWVHYESIIYAAGAVPVRAKIDFATFDLDIEAMSEAISPCTRAIIVNSPHNPTGKIYPVETLTRLAGLLTEASERYGQPIYLVSDEAYHRIVFDGRTFPSPVCFYPYSFLIYTYGKTLLTPGERIGYIALPPTMPDREEVRSMLAISQIVTGWAYPNNVLQYAVEDLERLSIDVLHLQRKRDRLVEELRKFGYQLHVPEGTFYLMVRSPWEDDSAFAEKLATHGILVHPGSLMEMPGYFRISLTASDEMIERALPGFKAAIAHLTTIFAAAERRTAPIGLVG